MVVVPPANAVVVHPSIRLTSIKFPFASRAASVEAVAAEATPVPVGSPLMTGVARVGEVPNTAAPLPVSSVNAPDKLAEVNEPSDVALPEEVIAPVKFASVVTFPAVKLEAVPVIFVPTKVVGVPKFGVTRVGEVENTKLVDVVPVVPVAAFK